MALLTDKFEHSSHSNAESLLYRPDRLLVDLD